MGCGNCGSKSTPNGCKSNGSCGTNSCNRLNAYDWLVNLPIDDAAQQCRVVEVSFSGGARKDFYRNSTLQFFGAGELVAVEGVSGFDVGEISLTGETCRLQLKKKGIKESAPDMRKILRRATERDIQLQQQHKAREAEALIRSRAITKQLRLNMKMSQIEFQADGKKATFFYIADDRVDFRELIKVLASEFKVKVEMRQIGARQEAGKVGGIGSCGRELCCSSWLTEFKSVNTTAARYQNLSINQTKLSGQCGRLKCCLNYELDTYLDALQGFPENADMLRVAAGTATLVKKDIFKNLMWYVLPNSNQHYPLTIERVQKIKSLNSQNIIPEELEAVEVTSTKVKEVEPEFVDVVGQISLRSLEKGDRKRRQQQRQDRDSRGNRGGAQAGGQRPPADGGKRNEGNPQKGGGNNRQNQQQQPPPQRRNEQRPPQGSQQGGNRNNGGGNNNNNNNRPKGSGGPQRRPDGRGGGNNNSGGNNNKPTPPPPQV